jgi:hypothetical protein
MSTITINKVEGQKLTVVIDNLDTNFIVGKVYPKQFKRYTVNNELFIPAFDEHKKFEGWAVVSPAPATIQDVAELGYDVFESALSSAVIKIQSRIRNKGDGKLAIDKQLAEITRQFIAGTITHEQLVEQSSRLIGNGIVQL